LKIRWLALLGLWVSGINPAASQSYHWPTNASFLLSSSFAEYRHNHFHAGIDIKTFGQNGLPVFAIRSGYIWQVRVSPYGYGRVIYQKLDTGEIAVYAHLQSFMGKLTAEIKREQQRHQEFTINKYFEPHEFPVEQGEIIAYTGESGIGPPHLHFEIRDPENSPINPLTKNFPVKDTAPPVISRLAILPLEAGTEINGDFSAQIRPVQFLGKAKFQIPSPIRVSGAVGLAVDCYDPIDLSTNKLGIYAVKFFVDGQLIYAAEYDTFTYAKTNQIFLDRDFRLLRQGNDVFYRCFRDRNNELEFYGEFPPESGIIQTRNFAPQFPQDLPGGGLDGRDSVFTDSLHSFKIEVADYFKNTTQLTGQFIFQAMPELSPQFTTDENGKVYLTNPGNYVVGNCLKFSIYLSDDWGVSWYPVYTWKRRAGQPGPENPQLLTQVASSFTGVKIVKMTATDLEGREYRPYFQVVQPAKTLSYRQAFLTLKKEFFDDFINFEILSSTPVIEKPQINILPETGEPIALEVTQIDLENFRTHFKLEPKYSGELIIQIFGKSADGKGIFYEENCHLMAVIPDSETTLKSPDGRCEVNFSKGSVFRTLFCRIQNQIPEPTNHLDIHGLSYQIEPFDVPLKSSAQISIKYPADLPDPEKLGIYLKPIASKNSWRFAGNDLDLQNGVIRTEVSVFDEYTLIRDDVPPEVAVIFPGSGMHLAQRRPTIKMKITDRLSGVRGDSQHMRLLVDGEKAIAEYDPETTNLFFQPGTDLTRGEHTLQVTARDRCGNITEKKLSFWIN
jgi:hypothetical protein